MKTKLSNSEISALSLELSMLLHAGVSVADGLSLMAQGGRGEEKELLSTLARKMDDGAGLAEAFRETGAFPSYVCGLVEVGERSGRTEEALSALSDYYESRARLERRVRELTPRQKGSLLQFLDAMAGEGRVPR